MIWLPRKEKTAFFREAANRLLSFEDELERNNYIEAVASAYKVSKESLEKLVAKTAVSTGLARPVTRPKKADGAVLQKGRRNCYIAESSAYMDDRNEICIQR